MVFGWGISSGRSLGGVFAVLVNTTLALAYGSHRREDD